MLLGRLDGRLHHSPARAIWVARARIIGVAGIAAIAGVPVGVDDILNWICGRTPPPRHSEGLNDPLAVAALFHMTLQGQEGHEDAIASSTLRVLRGLLDDRSEAETWASEDLIRYGHAFRAAQKALQAPYPAPTLRAVSERLQEVQNALEVAPAGGRTITSVDGRQLSFAPNQGGAMWIVAALLPQALLAAGLTINLIPSLVAVPRYLNVTPVEVAAKIEAAIGRLANEGLAELDRLEGRLLQLPQELKVTRRSRLPELLHLQLAYPGVRVPAIARLLGVSAQAAAKLAARARVVRSGLSA